MKVRSRFSRLVRVTKEDLAWLKKEKGKKSIAAFLEEVIKNNVKSKSS